MERLGLIATNLKLLYSFNIFKSQEKQILDPFSTIIKLALLNYKDVGTKLSIVNNQIYFSEPTLLQPPIRRLNGDTRDDIHNLGEPITCAIKWYQHTDVNIDFILKKALKGIEKLKESYTDENQSNLVLHTLDYFQKLIENSTDSTNDNINLNINSNMPINNNNEKPESEQHESDENIFPSNINNTLGEKLKNSWYKNDFKILRSLFEFADDNIKDNIEYQYLINSIEKYMDGKDDIIKGIIDQSSKSLK